MKRITRILPLLIVTASTTIFTACNREDSDKVDQDTIWALYELFYNENEDKTYARATFRFSNAVGTKLELSDDAEVRFNDTLIPWKSALAYYELDMAGNEESGTFEYADVDGSMFVNTISINPVHYPANLDTIPRDEAFELFWDGDPLGEYESVALWVNGINEGDAQYFIEADEGATSIILGVNQLEQLPEGPADFVMERYYSPPADEVTSAGGVTRGTFRPENTEVYMN